MQAARSVCPCPDAPPQLTVPSGPFGQGGTAILSRGETGRGGTAPNPRAITGGPGTSPFGAQIPVPQSTPRPARMSRPEPIWSGKGGETRTPDRRIWNPMLYQLSYAPRPSVGLGAFGARVQCLVPLAPPPMRPRRRSADPLTLSARRPVIRCAPYPVAEMPQCAPSRCPFRGRNCRGLVHDRSHGRWAVQRSVADRPAQPRPDPGPHPAL